MEYEEKQIRRTWTGHWIEPVQEPAWHTPDLNFEQMVAAEKSGVPSEKELRCAKHLQRLLRLENDAGELPVKAVAYATAHGVYELYVNGRKPDNRILAPETTNYHKLLWYQVYDISDLLEGSTVCRIQVFLGDGWWTGRLGMSGTSCNYGDKLGFLMDIELTYPDGSVTVIGTDHQYVSCDSFIRYSDLYIGEMQDGTAFDYMEPLIGAVQEEPVKPLWENCEEADYPTDVLVQQMIPGITVVKELPVVSYVETPAGDLVADFGQVTAGVVRIKVNAPAGSRIVIEHGEVLDRDGNYYNNIKGLYKDQKDVFLCRGGEQTFVPRFTYHGFRYVRITGIEKEQITELSALVYGTPMEKIGSFTTDNEMINQLQKAIENSTISNMISIPTDCPQREKLGWTGDINIFTGTGAFLYDLRDFLGSWLMQLRLDQTEDGEIPVVIPNHSSQDKIQRGMSGGTNSSAAWSDCCIFMPLKLYRIYGEISWLEDNYETMEKWMDYVGKQAENDLWTGRFHFGDWLIPSLRDEPDGVMKGVMATADITGACYYAMAAKAMAEICVILADAGRGGTYDERAAYYQNLRDRIRRAVVKAYVSSDGQVGEAPLQGLYVVILQSGAVTEGPVYVRDCETPLNGLEVKKKMLKRLDNLIREAGYTLDCGFSSILFLPEVLYENGYRETACKLLFSTDAPSWLYMIRHGATTIWENWRAIKEDGTVTDSSYNHYAYGCIGEFLYRHIGGIEPLAPGFRRIRIAPDFNFNINNCECSRIVSTGKIGVCWKLQEGDPKHGTIHVELPEEVTALLVLPEEMTELSAGVYDYTF